MFSDHDPGLHERTVARCAFHTQFAYCGTTVSAPRNIQIARLMGLGGLGVVELHPHLECLRRAGVSDDRLTEVLFRPPSSGACT